MWGVLKPGFLALLEDPFDPKLLDIIVFDVLPVSNGNDGADVSLAVELKDHNPLRHAFKVSSYCPTYLLEFIFLLNSSDKPPWYSFFRHPLV